MRNSVHYGSTFLKISNGLETFNPDNAVHATISNFIDDQAGIFLEKGGDKRVRDGKNFVARKDFNALPEGKRKKYWTFSDQEIIDMVKLQMKDGVTTGLEEIHSKLAKYSGNGHSRPRPVQTEAPAPKAKPSKSTGATTSANSEPGADHAVVSLLGL